MSTLAVAQPGVSAEPAVRTTVGSWLLTTDTRRLAILYLLAVTGFAVLGGLAMGLTRLELLTPAGDLMSPFVFGRMSSLHGILMLYFFLLPAIPMVFGTLLTPGMIGARGPAFPRLALGAWYLFVAGGVLVLAAALFGGVDSGWAYAVSTPRAAGLAPAAGMAGIFLACGALVLNGVNFLATVHALRGPGVAWSDLPLFVWALYAMAVTLLLAAPILGMALLLAGVESTLQLGLFDATRGGDPTILPQLAAFFAAPAAFLVLLPAMGVVSEIVAASAHRPLPNRRVVTASFFALAALSLLSWGNRMPTGEHPSLFAISLSLTGLLLIVPFLVIVGHWIADLRRASIRLDAALLYALGFILLTTIGMFLGLLLAPIGPIAYLRQTTFATAQHHYLVMGGGLLGLLAALHHWWHTLTGRTLPLHLSRIIAVALFIGLQLSFLPLFSLGILGAPAGHHSYPPEFQLHEVLGVAGTSLFGLALAGTLITFLASLLRQSSSQS